MILLNNLSEQGIKLLIYSDLEKRQFLPLKFV
jgi:hypothetical protein